MCTRKNKISICVSSSFIIIRFSRTLFLIRSVGLVYYILVVIAALRSSSTEASHISQCNFCQGFNSFLTAISVFRFFLGDTRTIIQKFFLQKKTSSYTSRVHLNSKDTNDDTVKPRASENSFVF